MPNPPYRILVDLPEAGLLLLVLSDASGAEIGRSSVPFERHVDNALLTGVDNLIKEHIIDRSVLTTVEVGQGIDKNSSLYRMVQSFSSGVMAASSSPSEKP